jgi:hypothetical protein
MLAQTAQEMNAATRTYVQRAQAAAQPPSGQISQKADFFSLQCRVEVKHQSRTCCLLLFLFRGGVEMGTISS